MVRCSVVRYSGGRYSGGRCVVVHCSAVRCERDRQNFFRLGEDRYREIDDGHFENRDGPHPLFGRPGDSGHFHSSDRHADRLPLLHAPSNENSTRRWQ